MNIPQMIVVLLLGGLAGCGSYQYVYPEFIIEAADRCDPNEGVKYMWVTSSNGPEHWGAGSIGGVLCNNTARFEVAVDVSTH